MGKWFPNLRQGSPEQLRTHDQAQRELNDYGKRAKKAGMPALRLPSLSG